MSNITEQKVEESEFKIPSTYFDRFYEFTGQDESSRGFIIAYVTSQGNPVIFSKTPNSIIEMGLRKSLEKFLDDMEGDKDGMDIEPLD